MPPSMHSLQVLRSSRLSPLRHSIEGRRFGSHSSHYNEPTGWMFGEKPPPPGKKRAKEDWETIWMVGMFGSMVLAAVGLYYKPDTSVQTWALKEAKERMEARGEVYKYQPSQNDSPS